MFLPILINNKKSRYSSKISIWNCNVSMQGKTFAWTGAPIMPEIVITYKGETLVEDVDYQLAYYDNIDAGNAYVRIYGINRFNSYRSSDFKIEGKHIDKDWVIEKVSCNCTKSYSCESLYEYSKYCSYSESDDICGNLNVYYKGELVDPNNYKIEAIISDTYLYDMGNVQKYLRTVTYKISGVGEYDGYVDYEDEFYVNVYTSN